VLAHEVARVVAAVRVARVLVVDEEQLFDGSSRAVGILALSLDPVSLLQVCLLEDMV
jgi:hypothetical protein